MKTERVRLRRTFASLTVATSMICQTGSSSPLTQVYDGDNNSYEPDRGGTVGGVGSPCMVRPIIELNADDGSMVNARGNQYLATSSMKWFVNGVDISTIEAWNNGYSINTAADYRRGTLTIYRNVPIGERCELTFEGDINDPRTNDNIHVSAGSVTLRTTDKSNDEWSMSILVDPAFEYDPLLDKLLLYDYLVAHGLQVASESDEAAADDVTSYRLSVPVEVRRGAVLQSGGYTLELYRVNRSTGALTQIQATTITESGGVKSVEASEVTAMTATQVDFDLRLIEQEEYLLIAKAGSKEVCRGSFGLLRKEGDYKLTPVNAAGVAPSDVLRLDVIQGRYDGKVLEHPAFAIRIIWKTQAAGSTTVMTHNEGETTEYNVGQAGLGLTYSDAELDQWVESEHKGVYGIAQSSSADGSKVYCDEDGVPYIFN